MMYAGKIVTAKLNPVRQDDLQTGVSEYIGKVCQWRALHIIEDGAYVGQWAMLNVDFTNPLPPFAWSPLCDLEIIRK